MTRYTLREISEKAGVSISTVSRVLSGKGLVSDDARLKVHSAIEELRQGAQMSVPSPLTGGLIGFFIPAPMSYIPTQTVVNQTLTEAIRTHAQRHGCNLIFSTWSAGSGPATPGDKLLKENRLSGAVFARTRLGDEQHLKKAASSLKAPVVMINRLFQIEGLMCVGVKHEQVGQLAAQHLMKLGHTAIAMIGGPQDTQSFAGRAKGFLDELRGAGLEPRPEWTVTPHLDPDVVRQALVPILDEDERPTAIFAGNDRMALVVLQEAQKRGISVPTDLSVIGVDGLIESELAIPALTTISMPWADMGRLAVDLIAQYAVCPHINSATLTLDVSLIERESTAPPGG
ncbi:MAG: LacI family DNA-binding transcriptional regulator [Limnochordia bacterium]